MSRTYKKDTTKNMFHPGEHGHHNTLMREFKCINGCWPIKEGRSIFPDERCYQSDRLHGIKRVANEKRRQALKRQASKMIEEELNEEL